MFAIGSTLFAVATVPGLSALAGAGLTNLLCFVGSWFFTTAAGMQLMLSRPPGSVEWYSAATQFVGTVLFNLSTGAALLAHAVTPERRLVWVPDVAGSSAFLASGMLGVVAVSATVGVVALRSPGWQAGWINLAGCVAFAVSAVAAYVRTTGVTADAALANLATFVGALCFLVAALLGLPRDRR